MKITRTRLKQLVLKEIEEYQPTEEEIANLAHRDAVAYIKSVFGPLGAALESHVDVYAGVDLREWFEENWNHSQQVKAMEKAQELRLADRDVMVIFIDGLVDAWDKDLEDIMRGDKNVDAFITKHFDDIRHIVDPRRGPKVARLGDEDEEPIPTSHQPGGEFGDRPVVGFKEQLMEMIRQELREDVFKGFGGSVGPQAGGIRYVTFTDQAAAMKAYEALKDRVGRKGLRLTIPKDQPVEGYKLRLEGP